MTLWIMLIAGALTAGFVTLAYRRRWSWTGFTSASVQSARGGKTLWDWLQLFIVPFALASVAFLLSQWQSDRDDRREAERAGRAARDQRQRELYAQKVATDAAREDTLRGYLSAMSDLMLERKLLKAPSRSRSTEVYSVARTLTLTALRRLDGERRGRIVLFLVEAGLIPEAHPRVSLKGADLREASLRGARLDRTALEGVDLRGADLREAEASTVDLSDADLRDARLENAYLINACLDFATFAGAHLQDAHLAGVKGSWVNFNKADLRRVDLTESFGIGWDLRGADLRGADLTGDSFEEAEPLRSADRAPAAQPRRGRDPVDDDRHALLVQLRLDGADLRDAYLPRGWGNAGTPMSPGERTALIRRYGRSPLGTCSDFEPVSGPFGGG